MSHKTTAVQMALDSLSGSQDRMNQVTRMNSNFEDCLPMAAVKQTSKI
jgi:hypothetical protein